MAEADKRFDDELLERFMRTFYGYGSFEAPLWFVGMEEGGGRSFEEIQKHVRHWEERGGEVLADLRDFHVSKGQERFFKGSRALQSTWRGIIRMILGDLSHAPSVEELKMFQAEELGRRGGDNCLPEFLPLPSRSLKESDWFYREHSSLPYLKDRTRYRETVAPWRADHLREQLVKHGPRVVVFYSVDRWYLQWWERIAGVPLREVPIGGHRSHFGTDGVTAFLVTKHPVTPGLKSEYFHRVGELITRVLES